MMTSPVIHYVLVMAVIHRKAVAFMKVPVSLDITTTVISPIIPKARRPTALKITTITFAMWPVIAAAVSVGLCKCGTAAEKDKNDCSRDESLFHYVFSMV